MESCIRIVLLSKRLRILELGWNRWMETTGKLRVDSLLKCNILALKATGCNDERRMPKIEYYLVGVVGQGPRLAPL